MAHHTRSNSFPSRTHPVASEIEEQLNRSASSESASTSSSSLCQKLNDLEDLHDCIEKLLLLPLNQKALAHEQQRKYVDELLTGSLSLFDVLAAAKEALLQTKESTQELQSILRRKRGAEITKEVKKYLASRKAVKKAVLKALKNLKSTENRYSQDGEIVNILQEAQTVTLNVMKSLLLFVSGPVSEGHLSVVSKLLRNKKIACEEAEKQENEIVNAEATLISMIGGKKNIQIENAQSELQKAESCIQDLEEGLESIYRKLIKARANILNILNH